jgi:hypothetical protein
MQVPKSETTKRALEKLHQLQKATNETWTDIMCGRVEPSTADAEELDRMYEDAMTTLFKLRS